MVEALLAVSVTTIAGAALLTSVGAAVRSSRDAADVAVARGLAEQMMDEIAAARFPASSDAGTTQTSGSTRETFETIDDYDDWRHNPPVDRHGRVIGTEGALIERSSWHWQIERLPSMQPDMEFLQALRREVQVLSVRPDAESGWTVESQPTHHRRVTVRVKYEEPDSNTRTLAEISRIFSYVPVAP